MTDERPPVAEPETRIDVDSLGEPAPPPFLDVDAHALDEVEADAERPLTEEEQRDMLAGVWELAFAGGGALMSRGQPDPVAQAIEETWSLPPASSSRLARSTLLAMPRSWRESRALGRLPIVVLAAQVGALVRNRVAATGQIVEAYAHADTGRIPAEPVPPGGRRAPGAPGGRGPGEPEPAGAGGGNGAAPPAGLGLGAPISERAAARAQRRAARGAAGGDG